ncbi:MAG: DUF1643 domain-containing protein [Roseburia sp.]|nr:DUF1643 domain-containing protein [Roseburia sp.]
MKNTLQDTITIEKQAVYSKDKKHRYELTLTLPGKKGKSILVVCLNPASSDLLVTDTTTNYLMNNLFTAGYTAITICNLFSTICGKLTARDAGDDRDGNLFHLQTVLERKFDTVLIGYGNTFATNRQVMERKAELEGLLRKSGKKAVELVDREEKYAKLKTIHPLFAGQRFSGEWKFRPYRMEENKNIKEGTPDVHQNQQKKPAHHTEGAEPVSGKAPSARGGSSRTGKTEKEPLPE